MKTRERILTALCLCGLTLNLLLLYWRVTDASSSIAGCGGAGDCDAVLASRWSQVFGVPVSVPGIVLYIALFAGLLWENERVRSFCFAALLAAALWFGFVQLGIIRQICPWCMAVHGIGLLIAVLGFIHRGRCFGLWEQAGIIAGISLALCQLYGPVPARFRLESSPDRMLVFEGGNKTFNASELPCIGSPQAKHVLIEYFDYRCAACRKMSGYLDALIRKHPTGVAVLVLPVPLERSCNHRMGVADEEHASSCALAKLSLAVWRAKPEAFANIHRAFLSEPSPDEAAAEKKVLALLSAPQLSAALDDPWIGKTLHTHAEDWHLLSKSTRKLPKLLIRDGRILHGLPSGEEDFIRVMEQELSLPVP